MRILSWFEDILGNSGVYKNIHLCFLTIFSFFCKINPQMKRNKRWQF